MGSCYSRVINGFHQLSTWSQIDLIFSSVLLPPEKIENTLSKENISFVRTLSFICPIFDDFTSGKKIIKTISALFIALIYC